MFFLVPTCGLCNRMRVIGNYYKLSKELNKKLVVLWFCENGMTIKSNELFSLPDDIRIINIKKLKKIIYKLLDILKNRCSLGRIIQLYDDDMLKLRESTHSDIVDFFAKHRNIYAETCINLEYTTLDIFKPTANVQESVDKIKNNLLWDNKIIGIHIRRTDNTWSIAGSPTALFENEIVNCLKTNPNQRFFLATDSVDEKKAFIDKFGKEHILTIDNINLSREEDKGQVDAYVELLVLASCKEIWGSYLSSYSRVASEIGKVELKVLKNEHSGVSFQTL